MSPLMTAMSLPQRLEEELDIHQSLSADGARHPNVLYMDSWFQDESYYYLILEICPHQVRQSYSKACLEGRHRVAHATGLDMRTCRLCWSCFMSAER